MISKLKSIDSFNVSLERNLLHNCVLEYDLEFGNVKRLNFNFNEMPSEHNQRNNVILSLILHFNWRNIQFLMKNYATLDFDSCHDIFFRMHGLIIVSIEKDALL